MKVFTKNLQFKKIKKYATFRTEVDKATELMCHRYVKNMIKKTDWKEIDIEVKKDLMAYIKETPFEVIMESTEHRKRVNGMTHMRASDRVCYWCLSEECLHIRKFHTSPENAELKRGELDKQTIHTCSVYNRKRVEALERMWDKNLKNQLY